MAARLQCPSCGSVELDLRSYESLIVISRDHALFTVCCPACSTRVSTIQQIPPELQEEVLFAAIEVGAGMGRE